jgi:hypothetical protein
LNDHTAAVKSTLTVLLNKEFFMVLILTKLLAYLEEEKYNLSVGIGPNQSMG